MNEPEKRLVETVAYSSNAEAEADVNLLKVRELLSSLPKESCPAGFEYRLNRRLQGINDRTRPSKSWISGWVGAGLGFAAAAIVALFLFDFGMSSDPATNQLTKTDVNVAPVKQETVDPNIAQQGSTPEEPKLATSTNDSVQRKEDPTYVSPDHLQQVSGGDGAVKTPSNK